MAFFNLWSSERLSFSLSVVAVISAAITSYYQFIYYESDLAIRITGSYIEPVDSIGDVEFGIKGVLMNSGTTTLTMVDHFGFFSADSLQDYKTRNSRNANGLLYARSPPEEKFTSKDLESILVPPKTTQTFNLSWSMNAERLEQLIMDTKASGSRYTIPTNHMYDDIVPLELGMHAEFVNPFAETSGIEMFPVILWYQVIDSTVQLHLPSIKSSGQGVYRIPPFEVMPEKDL